MKTKKKKLWTEEEITKALAEMYRMAYESGYAQGRAEAENAAVEAKWRGNMQRAGLTGWWNNLE